MRLSARRLDSLQQLQYGGACHMGDIAHQNASAFLCSDAGGGELFKTSRFDHIGTNRQRRLGAAALPEGGTPRPGRISPRRWTACTGPLRRTVSDASLASAFRKSSSCESPLLRCGRMRAARRTYSRRDTAASPMRGISRLRKPCRSPGRTGEAHRRRRRGGMHRPWRYAAAAARLPSAFALRCGRW